MSSDQRSSSAVRDLRSIFENKDNDTSSPAPRGRSPGDVNPESSGQTSKVRASFVSVHPSGIMSTSGPEEGVGGIAAESGKRGSTADLRRGSFSMSQENRDSALEDLKSTVTQEEDRREQDSSVAETIPEAAVEATPLTTPAVEPREDQAMGIVNHAANGLDKMTISEEKQEGRPENPGKPVSGAEDDSAGMERAPKINGGDASVAEKIANANKKAGKPAAVSTKTANKATPLASMAPKSPQIKTPLSANSSKADSLSPAATKQPTKKPSRSSLTAPTASSVARQVNAEKSPPAKTPAPSKSKPKDATKPMDISSRLTAPTAASRARQEDANKSATGTASGKATAPATSRPAAKPASARPTPRTSLAAPNRPSSRASNSSHPGPVAAKKPPAAAPDASFFERMMRPTAASANKAHEKTDVKSPPRQQKSSGNLRMSMGGSSAGDRRPMNGALKKSAGKAKSPSAEAGAEDVEHSMLDGSSAPVHDDSGSAGMADGTPAPETNGKQETMEGTPAAIGEEVR